MLNYKIKKRTYHTIIKNKIYNQRAVLKNFRYKSQLILESIEKMGEYIEKLNTPKLSLTEIMGIEGVASKVYFTHIFNNTGIAYLMTAQPDLAMEYFDRGIDYAKTSDRFVQNIALYCNKMIAKSYYNEKIEYSEIERLLIQIFDGMVCNNKLPFISSRYVMNLLMIALRNNPKWCKEILQNYEVIELINQGLRDNSIGSGQLLMQLEYLDQKLPELKLKSQCITTTKIIPVTGKRRDFIQKSGLNPFYFCTWL